jgi:hypothetical protein
MTVISPSVRDGSWWNRTRVRAPAASASAQAYSTLACPRNSTAWNSRARNCASWIGTSTPLASDGAASCSSPDRPAPAETERGIVGEVGEAGLAVADAEAEGLAALVRYLPGQDLETLRMRHALGEPIEGPPRAELAGPHREVRRRQPTGEGGDRVVAGGWKHHADPVRRAGARGEEREPVHVVPVQVRQQNGASERASPNSPLTRRRPVPASMISDGAPPSRETATHEVSPP